MDLYMIVKVQSSTTFPEAGFQAQHNGRPIFNGCYIDCKKRILEIAQDDDLIALGPPPRKVKDVREEYKADQYNNCNAEVVE